MSEEFQSREDFHGYSDREILLLLVQEVRYTLPIVNKRLDAHASDIKSLREWRNYLGGGLAVIGAYLGLGKTH